jgi:hypothetical protein
MRRWTTLKIWWTRLLIGLAVAVALAACGGDDDKDNNQPQPGQQTPETVIETAAPEVASESMATPFVALPELAFEDAVDAARTDLAARLEIRPAEIEALPPESEVTLGQPEKCPALPEFDLTVHYVYLQYERFIYPYQVYRSREAITQMGVEACDDVLIDEEVLFIPTPDARVAIRDMVLSDLVERGIDTTQGDFELVRTMTWTDEALGCPLLAGQDLPAPAIIDGFLMIYQTNGLTYEYHTDATGQQIVYCAPPPGYASAEEFIVALQADELFETRIVEDETALVEGLPGPGIMVALTDRDYRIGVFGYDSNATARTAAAQITDLAVWRAFVSGQVLIVLYDTSPPAYNVLAMYAEEVDLPAQDWGEPTPEPETSDGA